MYYRFYVQEKNYSLLTIIKQTREPIKLQEYHSEGAIRFRVA